MESLDRLMGAMWSGELEEGEAHAQISEKAKEIVLQVINNNELASYEKAASLNSLRGRFEQLAPYDGMLPEGLREANRVVLEALDVVVPKNTLSDYARRIAKMPSLPRRPSPQISSLPLEPFNKADFITERKDILEELAQISAEVPLFQVKELGERFASGVIGVLFPGRVGDQEVLFKLEKQYAGGRERELDIPRYTVQERHMASSFWVTRRESALLSTLKHSAFPHFLGMIYVKSKNQWGNIYEKIDAEGLDTLLNRASYFYTYSKVTGDYGEKAPTPGEMVPLLIDWAEGLKALQERNYPMTDVKADNFLIRHSDKKGMVVDHARENPTDPGDLRSRQRFGNIILKSLMPWIDLMTQDPPREYDIARYGIDRDGLLQKELPEELVDLLINTWSPKPLSEFGWDAIIQGLKDSIKKLPL